MDRRRRLPEALALCLSVAAALVLAEVGLRFVPALHPPGGKYDQLFQFDRDLGWSFRPHAEEVVASEDEYRTLVKVNSEGFREREPDPNTAPVVAVLGDSFVSNFGVDQAEVFTRQMHGALQPAVSVRNFGVNGYSQVQELLLLDRLVRAARPALVLMVLYVQNDLDDNTGAFDWERGVRRPRCRLRGDGTLSIEAHLSEPRADPGPSPVDRLRELRLYRLLRKAFHRFRPDRVPLGEQPPEVRYCRVPMGAAERVAFETTQALMRAAEEKCASQGCALGFVLAPSLWQVEAAEWGRLLERFSLPSPSMDRRQPNRLLAQFCARQGYPCIDLLPVLEARAREGERLYFRKEQHWNALGQRRVAEALVRWIRDENLIPAANRERGVTSRRAGFVSPQ